MGLTNSTSNHPMARNRTHTTSGTKHDGAACTGTRGENGSQSTDGDNTRDEADTGQDTAERRKPTDNRPASTGPESETPAPADDSRRRSENRTSEGGRGSGSQGGPGPSISWSREPVKDFIHRGIAASTARPRLITYLCGGSVSVRVDGGAADGSSRAHPASAIITATHTHTARSRIITPPSRRRRPGECRSRLAQGCPPGRPGAVAPGGVGRPAGEAVGSHASGSVGLAETAGAGSGSGGGSGVSLESGIVPDAAGCSSHPLGSVGTIGTTWSGRPGVIVDGGRLVETVGFERSTSAAALASTRMRAVEASALLDEGGATTPPCEVFMRAGGWRWSPGAAPREA